MLLVPYGTMEVIYDDGYTFNFGSDGFAKYVGFTTPLTVLGDPVNEVMIISLPNKILENGDKPLSNTKGKPTNSEFIALIADKLQLQLKSAEVTNF